MKSRAWRVASLAFLLTAASTVRARAEQIQVVDVTYVHSDSTTADSHYRVPGMTTSLTSPVNYAGGSVHIRVEVFTKPSGGAPTKFQACFEGRPTYSCSDQSPTYREAGVIEWDSQFSRFWSPGTTDWSLGTGQIALILKDDANNKPAGDPRYMPSSVHISMWFVSAGSTFTPPAMATPDAGPRDAGATIETRDAGVTTSNEDAGEDEPMFEQDASSPPATRDAGEAAMSPRTGGSANTARGSSLVGQTCQVGDPPTAAWILFAIVIAISRTRRPAMARVRRRKR